VNGDGLPVKGRADKSQVPPARQATLLAVTDPSSGLARHRATRHMDRMIADRHVARRYGNETWLATTGRTASTSYWAHSMGP